MQNFGGVVIHMQLENKTNTIEFWENAVKVSYVFGTAYSLGHIKEEKPHIPFSDDTMQFLGALSERLLKNKALRIYPEVTAFAFWCRMVHLEQMKTEYGSVEERRLGRGVSLHFTPSNMPVLFAFSMAAGLLAGNCVILRLAKKETRQEQGIVYEIKTLLEREFISFQNRIVMCRYEHDREITDALSDLCDVRVMWGSDQSIAEIRKSPLPPRATELSFASRGSAAVLSATELLHTKNLDLLTRQFYNDTYLNDQNACSSPHMIYWLGTHREVAEAQERFWSAVCTLLDERQYQIPAAIGVRKLNDALVLAAKFEGIKIYREKNRLVRVQVTEFQKEMWDHTVPGGFFIECEGMKLDGLMPILTSYCQTVCIYGVDGKNLLQELIKHRIEGVDRIVSVGQALEFSLTWDGFDLIDAMSRRIYSREYDV